MNGGSGSGRNGGTGMMRWSRSRLVVVHKSDTIPHHDHVSFGSFLKERDAERSGCKGAWPVEPSMLATAKLWSDNRRATRNIHRPILQSSSYGTSVSHRALSDTTGPRRPSASCVA